MSEKAVTSVPVSEEARLAKMSHIQLVRECAKHVRRPKTRMDGIEAVVIFVSLLGAKLPGQDPYLLSRRSQTPKTYMNAGMGKLNV